MAKIERSVWLMTELPPKWRQSDALRSLVSQETSADLVPGSEGAEGTGHPGDLLGFGIARDWTAIDQLALTKGHFASTGAGEN